MAGAETGAHDDEFYRVLRRELTYLWFALAVISINIHLHLGVVEIRDTIVSGESLDPLSVLFLIGAIGMILVIAGIYLHTVPTHEMYLVGMVYSLLLIYAYVDWHVLGTISPLIFDVDRPSGAPLELLSESLLADPLALVSKAAEAALAMVFGILYSIR